MQLTAIGQALLTKVCEALSVDAADVLRAVLADVPPAPVLLRPCAGLVRQSGREVSQRPAGLGALPVVHLAYGLIKRKCSFLLAEAVRFELTDGFPHRWFSRPVP